MHLHRCIYLSMVLIFCVNARWFPNEGRWSNNRRESQNGKYTSRGTFSDPYARFVKPRALSSHLHHQGWGRLVYWSSFQLPAFQYPRTSSSHSVPTRTFNSPVLLRILFDPFLNASVAYSRPPVQVLKGQLRAGTSKASLPEDTISGTLPVNVQTTPFQINSNLNAEVAHTPLPVDVADASSPITMSSAIPLRAKTLNVSVPVGILVDTVLDETENSALGIDIIGRSLAAGIANPSLPVKFEKVPTNLINLPLPAGLVNASIPVILQNDTLYTSVSNLPVPVNIVNKTLRVNITNAPLEATITNTPLVVEVVHQTLLVNLAEKPVSVHVVNDSLPANVLETPVNTTVSNVPLPIGVANTTLIVELGNSPLPVVIANETVEVNSTMLLDGLTAVLKNITIDIKESIDRKPCPPKSNYGNDPTAPCTCLNSSYICYFNISRSYDDAKALCQYLGFDGLVSFDNAIKQSVVFRVGRLLGNANSSYWTSGNDKALEGKFVWDPSGAAISEGLWERNEPNDYNGNEDCVIINMASSGLLNDLTCSRRLPFICEASNVASVFA